MNKVLKGLVAVAATAAMAIAGVAGALTVSRRIFFVQAVPAIVALLISV